MQSYARRTRTQVFQEIAIECPTTLVDLEKLIAMARNGIVREREADDTFTIYTADDELVIRWVSHDRTEPTREQD